MFLRKMISLLALMAMNSQPLFAEDMKMPTAVVELFTSQSCQSCPPADRIFEGLAHQSDIIALAFHVDYWNYRGWTDTLGSPNNTARQYSYARSFRRNGVYTPQAIINGKTQLNGADADLMRSKIASASSNSNGLTVPVSAELKGDALDIAIGAGSGKADIVVVYYKRRKEVNVLKGENKGQRISYWNSVMDVQQVGMWNGNAQKLNVPAKALQEGHSDGLAILLQTSTQNGDLGQIIGATSLLAANTSY